MVEQETITEEEQKSQEKSIGIPATLEIEGDELEELESEVSIKFNSYRGFLSGQKHGHSMNKHNIIEDVGVSEDFVKENMVTEPTDHASLWELHYRKEEFRGEEVFQDDVDPSKGWERVDSLKDSAYIDEMTHSMLKNF